MSILRLAGAAPGHAMNAARRMGLVPLGFATRSIRRATVKALVLPVLGAFGAGLAIGAGLGLLVAPMSGKKLRSRIRSSASGFVRRGASHVES